MNWLNYHHLLYFWTVAKSPSLTQAAQKLHLSQPTVSSQIKQLESSLGVQLFERQGRRLVLTEAGQTVFRYAEEIFALGQELADAVEGRLDTQRLRLVVGVPDALPKLIVYQLLSPILQLEEDVQLVCHEGKFDELLRDLALHRLDLLLTDSPIPPHSHVKAYNHMLGECSVTVFGTPELHDQYKSGFPASLHAAPMLLPTPNTSLRFQLDGWFDGLGIQPLVKHEFEDSAILKVFGQAGEGLFFTPSAIREQVARQYSVKALGSIEEIKERYYAVSVQRRLKHPAVVAIQDHARRRFLV